MVFALSAIGAGDFVSNTAAGSIHGYNLLWVLVLALIFRFVWLNTSAKYVLITKETLIQGFSRVGNWIIWANLISLIVLGHLFNLYKYALMGNCLTFLLPLPTSKSTTIWLLFCVLTGYVLMIKGGYKKLEIFLKALIAVMGFFLVIAAFLAKPQPLAILKGMLIPVFPESQSTYSTILLIMALIGTEAGSITNISYTYFLDAKGWKDRSMLKYQRRDLIFGIACIFLIGALLQIVAAGVIVGSVPNLETAEDLVEIFSRQLGFAGRLIFAFGLWAAVFSSYIGITSGYAMIVTDILRKIVIPLKRSFGEGQKSPPLNSDPIYIGIIAFWSFSPLYILLTDWKPVLLTLVAQASSVVMIPIIGWALLRITNDIELMGQYRNSLWTNAVLIIMIFVSIFCIFLIR
ncbi:Nramp family divalent metal transporter [Acidobacteriota bacterium]